MRFLLTFPLFCWGLTNYIYSQPSVLLLQNPSFEDEPGFSRTPRGWFYCGEMGETPPDIHPLDLFGVVHKAQQGRTYIGMVVRDNGTWEGVSQWLSMPLEAGQCYEFSLYAARSPQYESLSRKTWQLTNFDHPVVVRIWGGNLNCEKAELLVTSPLIGSADWQLYTFQFQPATNYNRMVIEAYYETDTAFYCGNVLLDHASPILPIDCENKQALVKLDSLQINELQADTALAELALQITFSDVDQQLEQHAFYLRSGELQQANKPLFILSQIAKNTPNRKLIFYLKASNKSVFKLQSENLERELLLYGVNKKQFRINKYHPAKGKSITDGKVIVEIQ